MASSEKAALVTGGSRGIGLAIARMLADEGYDLTVAARQPENLEQAREGLNGNGVEVQTVAANVASEKDIADLVSQHESRFGRLDVLVNSAGLGIGSEVERLETKTVDLQLQVNLRAIALLYRECVPMLRKAAANGDQALVINLSSIAGKSAQPWTSIYSATKHAVVGFTNSMNRELGAAGIKSCALCPSFVDTDMTDYMKEAIPPEEMIRPEDVAEMSRAVLRVSRWCLVPEVMMMRPGENP